MFRQRFSQVFLTGYPSLNPFCVWVWPGTTSLFTWLSWNFCLSFYSLGWNNVECIGGKLLILIVFLSPTFLPGPHPTAFFSRSEEAKVWFPDVQDSDFVFPPSLPLGSWIPPFHGDCRLSLIFTSPTSLSLVRMWSSSALLLVGFSITWRLGGRSYHKHPPGTSWLVMF